MGKYSESVMEMNSKLMFPEEELLLGNFILFMRNIVVA